VVSAHQRQPTRPATEDRLDRDFILRGKIRKKWSWSFRARSTAERRWSWSARFPWLPPAGEPSRIRGQVQLGVQWESGERRLQVRVQHQREDDAGLRESRTLVTCSGRWSLGSRWRLRCGQGSAWGDPVNLMTAIAPLAGRVIPRHWGTWRSEIHLGVGWEAKWGRIWLAGARRIPAESRGSAHWQVWSSAEVAW
jgi:hypothetical protein